jgi:hypothetical protein
MLTPLALECRVVELLDPPVQFSVSRLAKHNQFRWRTVISMATESTT